MRQRADPFHPLQPCNAARDDLETRIGWILRSAARRSGERRSPDVDEAPPGVCLWSLLPSEALPELPPRSESVVSGAGIALSNLGLSARWGVKRKFPGLVRDTD